MALTAIIVCCGVLATFWEPALAECPTSYDIDVKWNSTHYIGAYWYDGQSASTAQQSCRGHVMKRYEGFQESARRGFQFLQHAWVVRPGCKAYEFSDYNYRGTMTEYEVGVHPDVPKGSKSYRVRCSIAHFRCKPIDRFEAVLTCDATQAVAETECNYQKTIGTKFSSSVSHAFHLEAKLEAEMSASFFGLFSATLRMSLATGYNWGTVSESAKETTKTYQVNALAPAGYILKIEQAVGRCGNSLVKTELFRISHYGKTGAPIVQKYIKESKNVTEIVN